jgi:hypothetical protein
MDERPDETTTTATVVYHGARESAEWALETLRQAGIDAEISRPADAPVDPPAAPLRVPSTDRSYHVTVDAECATHASEVLQQAESESRRRVDVITDGLRRSALRAVVPAVLIGFVELCLNDRPYDRALPWILFAWGVAFVLFARRDYHDRGRAAMRRGGSLS